MKLVVRLILGVILTLALVMGSACGGSTSSSTSNPSTNASSTSGGNLAPQVSMPSNFPSDFPIYTGARLVSAGTFTSNGTSTWSLDWETRDGVDKVQAFYTAKLAEGDWAISFSGGSNGTFSAIFNRKSNSSVGGILGVGVTTGITTINLALTNGG